VVLGFTVPEARAIVDYREKNGAFKSVDDVLKIPGLDPARLEAQKSRMAF
jgi:competence protein ComEA